MTDSKSVIKDINKLTSELISVSLCNRQQYPSIISTGNDHEISFKNMHLCNIALKNKPYNHIYQTLHDSEAYNVLMIDGALLQFQYKFINCTLVKHRLAFFPSPTLDDYQNNPEVYEDDEIYADILDRSIVPFPIRFDFDLDPGAVVPIEHPKSHLTLGQYENCRIPVSAPLSPYCFLNFILINFYHSALNKYRDKFSVNSMFFKQSLFDDEKKYIHITVPS